MQTEGIMRSSYSDLVFNGLGDIDDNSSTETSISIATIPVTSTSASVSSLGANYIEHRVSKIDTLAGVAIKYGVEIADIKRMNGLVNDLQMFAHRTLQIPLPGRHPPSPCLSDGSIDDSSFARECTARRPCSDVMDMFESLKLTPTAQNVSPAMSSLQGYYGLKPVRSSPLLDISEMAVYGAARHSLDTEPLSAHNSLPKSYRKSRSLAKGFSMETGQNAGAGFCTPEKLLKDRSNGFCVTTGKGLVPRTKSGNRTYMESISNGDSAFNKFSSVRRSSSTSCLQESENTSFIWPTSLWPLTVDAFTRPIFDGLPKPFSAKRNKAALD